MADSRQKTVHSRFTSGSIFNHIVVMSVTGGIGLLALFFVDLADMYFLSLLGETELAAAIGYAGTILFFTASISIGLSIATGVVTAKAVGEGKDRRTRQVVMTALFFSAIIAIATSIVIFPLTPMILEMLGAAGRTHSLAMDYLQILLPTLGFLGLGMSTGGVLRAVGDAKGAMMVTLIGSAVNLVLDPIFIFGLDLHIQGAALASVSARITLAGVGLYLIFRKHDLGIRINFRIFKRNLSPMLKVAMPAIFTNIATPIGNAYVITEISMFGDAAIAGNTIVARITPVAFALFFSLSGSIGPIIGQNLGAKEYDRVKESIYASLKFIIGYTVILWPIFYLSQDMIIALFGASEDAGAMIRVFCNWVVPLTMFLGILFLSNAAFNNLGHPLRATFFNVGKATIGTIPFAYYGSKLYGAEGVLIGQAIGAAIFGFVGVIFCLYTIDKVVAARRNNDQRKAQMETADNDQPQLMPYSSARTFNYSSKDIIEQSE
ncbi:MATE family efflux transporter [Kordiimonas sp. SCSIO 12610]|uniref:MATE family efflux transporter n=1 Tax=Kordiimonas sp. SCSIO 12610 TaxID=2829597 RepID=UPI00210A9976|nr:MATE family efflux transporter [Kordiimonas sp. SCSIO 12610]UTW54358.1 MATE family efflux transporter [Kordiimonas sp. SCSIO 12610]